MSLISNKQIKKYFLTKNSNVKTQERVELVLSPEFYWCRIFEIPVKSTKKALKVVPTLFEEYLNEGTYSYYCIALDNSKFLCFAYDNEIILQSTKQSGISFSQIHKVFFAQTQMKAYESFEINKNSFMYENGILIKVPSSFLKEPTLLSEKLMVKDNAHKLDFKFYTQVLDKKYLYAATFILLFISLFNGAKYLQYNKAIELNTQKEQSLKKQYKVPRTSLQLNAILRGATHKLENNTKFQKALEYVLNLKRHDRTVLLKQLLYSDKQMSFTFSKANEKRVKKYIQKAYPKASFSKEEGMLKGVISL